MSKSEIEASRSSSSCTPRSVVSICRTYLSSSGAGCWYVRRGLSRISVFLVPRRERVPRGWDRVLAADPTVSAMRDALATADVAQDLGRPLVGAALRFVSRAGAARPRLLHDPVVTVFHHVALLGHQILLLGVARPLSYALPRR